MVFQQVTFSRHYTTFDLGAPLQVNFSFFQIEWTGQKMTIILKIEQFPFSEFPLLVGETILVLGETMWAELYPLNSNLFATIWLSYSELGINSTIICVLTKVLLPYCWQ